MSDLDDLAAEFAAFAPAEKKGGRTAREERIIAGFEDILRFVDEHGRAPMHGEGRDIFERLYAVRLDRIRAQADCRELVLDIDRHGLLAGAGNGVAEAGEPYVSDEDLAAEFGGLLGGEDDITTLKHVRSREEINAAEEIANRKACEDFDAFKPLFKALQRDLDNSLRVTHPIRKDAGFLKTDIKAGEFFILGGQVAYIADVGEQIKAPNGENDARLRVVYSNGTESDLLLRSLQRALYKDEASRRVSDPDAGPLFAGEAEEDDTQSGTVYVLRSLSEHPYVAEHRQVLHKIGVTGGTVEARIAQAATDATYLLAGVEIVATWTLYNINRTRLENLLHRLFAPARLDLTIADRFGNPVQPREWFLVPLSVIDEAVGRVKDGSITGYRYAPEEARLVKAG